VARGEEDRRSDTDLLLLFEDEEKALQAEDETAKIAAESSDINLSIVNKDYDEFSRNPYFPFEVLRDGIVLYKKPSMLLSANKVQYRRLAVSYLFGDAG